MGMLLLPAAAVAALPTEAGMHAVCAIGAGMPAIGAGAPANA